MPERTGAEVTDARTGLAAGVSCVISCAAAGGVTFGRAGRSGFSYVIWATHGRAPIVLNTIIPVTTATMPACFRKLTFIPASLTRFA